MDNNSRDPLVRNVIDGFSRRGLFHELHMMDSNNRSNFVKVFNKHLSDMGDYHVFMESDVEILTKGWLSKMIHYFQSDKFGMLGSAIDQDDFIDVDKVGKKDKEMAKIRSRERTYDFSGEGVLMNRPAGRLAVRKTKLIAGNIESLYNDNDIIPFVESRGYKVGIVKEVVHRHLSLLNYYDYDNYNMARRMDFFTK
jgi:hypothetical protein